MDKPFWKQVNRQLCWGYFGDPDEASLKINVGDVGDWQITGWSVIPLAHLRKTSSGAYEFEVTIGHPEIQRVLEARLRNHSFASTEEAKSALQEIVNTMDLSSLEN